MSDSSDTDIKIYNETLGTSHIVLMKHHIRKKSLASKVVKLTLKTVTLSQSLVDMIHKVPMT